MFRALQRLLSKIKMLFAGKMNEKSDKLSRNPTVMAEGYDKIIRKKAENLQRYKNAIANFIALRDRRRSELANITEEVIKFEGLKGAALKKAKNRAMVLAAEGMSEEDIKRDEEYMRHRKNYADFSSTLEEKQKRTTDIEAQVEDYIAKIEEHKSQMEEWVIELKNLRGEKEEAVADVITSNEETEISDMMNGLATDGAGAELMELRNQRAKAKANAQISSELRGVETARSAKEYETEAELMEVDNELDNAIFGELQLKNPQTARTDHIDAGNN